MLEAGAEDVNRGTMAVLLVAAKKEKIADYTGVISQAGRVPVVMDVNAFALQNAFEANYGIDMARVVVLVNAGASAININIIEGGQSLFTRDISIGGNAYTEALQKELRLTVEDADQLKRGVSVGEASVEDADPIVRTVTENLLLEVEKTFDFFKATAASDRIDVTPVCATVSIEARLGPLPTDHTVPPHHNPSHKHRRRHEPNHRPNQLGRPTAEPTEM